ncbi:MAG TPA: DUF4350 domain-containing protein [Candidatus Tumulicola sp.]|jgi:hypothetical protein
MNARGRDTMLLAIAIVALLAIAFARDRAKHPESRPTFSSYDAGRYGYRALYAVLQNSGVTVRRLRRPLSTLGAGGTLLVSDNAGDPAAIRFDKADKAALQRFVSGGGRLVVLAWTFDGAADIVPKIPASKDTANRYSIGSEALFAQTGIRSVDTPAQAAFAAPPHSSAVLWGNNGGRVAIAYRLGKGTVIASTSPESFGNEKLLQRDNVRFAYAALAGHGPVTFDEYAHGYDDDATFWQAVPREVKFAVLLAGIVVLAGAIGANVPFAPPVPLDAPDERTSAAYVDAMGSLLRRARARSDAIATFVRDARKLPASPQRASALEELDRLLAATPTDAALRRAALLDFQLRKDRI